MADAAIQQWGPGFATCLVPCSSFAGQATGCNCGFDSAGCKISETAAKSNGKTLPLHGLLAAMQSWNEDDLDRLRIPHPLLGKMRVCEMILFMLYHNLQHLNSVRRRLGQEILPV
jgi:hypothetical protein